MLDNAQLYRNAQEAVRVRDEFLSIASHELKTPLTGLRLQVQSTLRLLRGQPDEGLQERLTNRLAAAERQTQRLVQLIDDLLDVSRVKAGRLELMLEEVDLSGLVREVAERFEQEAAASGCALIVEAQGGVIGRWDRLRIEQVLTNLLSNALKYGRGNPVEIDLRAARW